MISVEEARAKYKEFPVGTVFQITTETIAGPAHITSRNQFYVKCLEGKVWGLSTKKKHDLPDLFDVEYYQEVNFIDSYGVDLSLLPREDLEKMDIGRGN